MKHDKNQYRLFLKKSKCKNFNCFLLYQNKFNRHLINDQSVSTIEIIYYQNSSQSMTFIILNACGYLYNEKITLREVVNDKSYMVRQSHLQWTFYLVGNFTIIFLQLLLSYCNKQKEKNTEKSSGNNKISRKYAISTTSFLVILSLNEWFVLNLKNDR